MPVEMREINDYSYGQIVNVNAFHSGTIVRCRVAGYNLLYGSYRVIQLDGPDAGHKFVAYPDEISE